MATDITWVAERLAEFVGDVDPATKKGRKRAAIIEVATARFAEQGYRATSMDEIASAVGVAKGTLYLYFPRKLDLMLACVAREKLAWIPEVEALFHDESLPAAERLKRWIVMVLTLPRESPLIARLMDDGEELGELMAELPVELMAQTENYQLELLGPLLQELVGKAHRWSAVELRDRMMVLRTVGMLGPILAKDWSRVGLSFERMVAIWSDLIVDGLRPRPSEFPTPPRQAKEESP